MPKETRRGATKLSVSDGRYRWYITVGRIALCSRHAPPHLHRHFDPAHAGHEPKVFVDPQLTFREALRRIGQFCDGLDREPPFEELRQVLA